jgi:hypothetical protein
MDAPPKPDSDDALPPGFPQRLQMYAMLFGSVMSFKVPRFA